MTIKPTIVRQPRRFERTGYLVADPRVLFEMYVSPPPERVNVQIGNVEIVEVRGPLVHHPDGWTESYDEILDRVGAACEGSASIVVLKIDSAGGELSGCFDTARMIRSRVAAAGKRLVSYVEGCAASGGYALAAAGERIYAEQTAIVGSLGVLNVRLDVSANDASQGIRFATIASGKRKSDGFIHQPLRDDELEATQARVDSLAQSFFDLVSELRGMSVDAVRGLQAGVLHGSAALASGLVDEIGSFDALLANLASGGSMADDKKDDETQNDLDAARAALEKAAEGDGDDANRARAALSALDGKKPEEAESKSDGDGDGESDDEKKNKDSARSSAVSSSVSSSVVRPTVSGELSTTIVSLVQRMDQLEGRDEQSRKAALFASRPELPKSMIKLCSDKSFAAAKEIVDAYPKPVSPIVSSPAATAVVSSTRGDGQSSTTVQNKGTNHSGHGALLDERMGLSPKAAQVKRTPHSLEFDIGDSLAHKPREVVAGKKA